MVNLIELSCRGWGLVKHVDFFIDVPGSLSLRHIEIYLGSKVLARVLAQAFEACLGVATALGYHV